MLHTRPFKGGQVVLAQNVGYKMKNCLFLFSFCSVPRDRSSSAILSLPSTSTFLTDREADKPTDWMTEEVDLIPGMMLSKRRPKTHLRNQTVGGEMGHVGKQLFWRRRLSEQYVHTSAIFICSLSCCRLDARGRVVVLSELCFLVVHKCFRRRCSGYRYKSIEHSSSSSSTQTCSRSCSCDATSCQHMLKK